jgi:hypothetical protein
MAETKRETKRETRERARERARGRERQKSRAATPKPEAAPPDNSDPAAIIDAQRRELARRLAIFASDWRRCPQRICRRNRACTPADIVCFSPPPARKTTPEQDAEAMAWLSRELKRRLGRG